MEVAGSVRQDELQDESYNMGLLARAIRPARVPRAHVAVDAAGGAAARRRAVPDRARGGAAGAGRRGPRVRDAAAARGGGVAASGDLRRRGLRLPPASPPSSRRRQRVHAHAVDLVVDAISLPVAAPTMGPRRRSTATQPGASSSAAAAPVLVDALLTAASRPRRPIVRSSIDAPHARLPRDVSSQGARRLDAWSASSDVARWRTEIGAVFRCRCRTRPRDQPTAARGDGAHASALVLDELGGRAAADPSYGATSPPKRRRHRRRAGLLAPVSAVTARRHVSLGRPGRRALRRGRRAVLGDGEVGPRRRASRPLVRDRASAGRRPAVAPRAHHARARSAARPRVREHDGVPSALGAAAPSAALAVGEDHVHAASSSARAGELGGVRRRVGGGGVAHHLALALDARCRTT